MREIFEHGGVVMQLIVVVSVVGFGFVVERILAFRRASTPMDLFYPELEGKLRLGQLEEARQLCREETGLIPQVMEQGLEQHHQGESLDAVKQVLADEVQLTVLPRLERHLALIGVIIRVAPMLGLLGTVMGMIAMFQEISANPNFQIGDISRGIFRALGTTAAGLFVAIPLIFFHAYFTTRVERFEVDAQRYLTRLVRLLARRQELSRGGKPNT